MRRLVTPGFLLRAEGAAMLALVLGAYASTGQTWLLFIALVLLPDLAMLGYLANVRVRSTLYNLAHNYLLPVMLAIVAWLSDSHIGITLALIWIAHIAVDRIVGYGLKYPTGFRDTHLQRV